MSDIVGGSGGGGGGDAPDEMGTVDHGTIASGSQSSVSVTFSESYDTAPGVVHGVGSTTNLGTGGGDVIAIAVEVTTTGFTSKVYNPNAGDITVDKAGYAVKE